MTLSEIGPVPPASSTVPSFGARATYCEPTMPFPPGLLSTSTGRCSVSDMLLAIVRIMLSIVPPLAYGTTMKIGWLCAFTIDGAASGASSPPPSKAVT